MNPIDHFSIDLETLGIRYDTAIVSIGVQQFDPNTGKMGATFYREIDLDSALKSGSVTGSTLRWWMAEAGDKARAIFTAGRDKSPLATALDELRTWMSGLAPVPKVWGYGSVQDIQWLEHAYHKGCVGLVQPWVHGNVRCMRTIVEDAQLDGTEWPKRVGVHHNSLDDATYQAQVISYCRMKINKALHGEKKASQMVKRQVVAQDDDEL
jgi:exodeoxyribonuclease VIII